MGLDGPWRPPHHGSCPTPVMLLGENEPLVCGVNLWFMALSRKYVEIKRKPCCQLRAWKNLLHGHPEKATFHLKCWIPRHTPRCPCRAVSKAASARWETVRAPLGERNKNGTTTLTAHDFSWHLIHGVLTTKSNLFWQIVRIRQLVGCWAGLVDEFAGSPSSSFSQILQGLTRENPSQSCELTMVTIFIYLMALQASTTWRQPQKTGQTPQMEDSGCWLATPQVVGNSSGPRSEW